MESPIANRESRIRRIAVIGAGTMGHGIAQVAAMAGFDTVLTDANPSAIAAGRERIRANLAGAVRRGKIDADAVDAVLNRITGAEDLSGAVRDAHLIVEAVLEDLDVKRALFARVDAAVSSDAILATNTSSYATVPVSHPLDSA